MAIRPQMAMKPIAKAAGAVMLVVLTAIFTYMFTARLNVETAVQQQRTTAIQQFDQTGAQMDASLSLFVDALLSRQKVDDARTSARTAITLHAAQADGLAPLTGTGNVVQYVNSLGDLRVLVDQTNGKLTAKKMAQQHVDLMAYRKKLTAMAKGNVYK